jgi:hypothetical protein
MKLLDWFRRRRRDREVQAEAIDDMRRADEPKEQTPREVYLSQTRD